MRGWTAYLIQFCTPHTAANPRQLHPGQREGGNKKGLVSDLLTGPARPTRGPGRAGVCLFARANDALGRANNPLARLEGFWLMAILLAA
jgi:hypothetical protein